VFDPKEWKRDIVNAAFPVLAKQALEAAAAQMMALGVDIRKSARVKHLQGQHDQSTHGRGGGTATEEKPQGDDRATRAKLTYKPSTGEKQRVARKEQQRVADVIGGENILGHMPFDVHVGDRVGIEVKTIMDNNNDKITLHPDSKERKLSFARKHRMRSIHTVAVDVRGGKRKYYYKKGIGAFRLTSMEEVPLKRLKEIFGEFLD
jgi:hypothetical protein